MKYVASRSKSELFYKLVQLRGLNKEVDKRTEECFGTGVSSYYEPELDLIVIMRWNSDEFEYYNSIGEKVEL